MAAGDRRRRLRRAATGAAAVALLAGIGCWPTSQFVGINYVVSERTLPLWVKAMDFINRDLNLARTAHTVLSGAADDEAKAAAAFAWTRANIRPQPAQLPIVDDHIWHIIVRGYGQRDQQADVFTTLLAYAGVRAYWSVTGMPPDELPLSYVRVSDRWRVYDVANGVVFRNRDGAFATPQEVTANLELVRTAAAQANIDSTRYLSYFAGYRAPQVPEVLRADLQMPRRRLWHEARRMMGLRGSESRAPSAAAGAEGQP